jgi:hypothetical protein
MTVSAWFMQAPAPYAGNYTTCAVQTTGLHFFNKKPDPSGQQYTGISVAEAAMKLIPKAEINNKVSGITTAALYLCVVCVCCVCVCVSLCLSPLCVSLLACPPNACWPPRRRRPP